MARVGIGKAKQLLQEVMAEFGVTLADLRSRSRTENVCLAKEAFCVRSGELKLSTAAMAEALGVTRYTIHNRSDPKARERHRQRERRRRAGRNTTAFSPLAMQGGVR